MKCGYVSETLLISIGFFNEADTFESSLILIYSNSWVSLFTEMVAVKLL